MVNEVGRYQEYYSMIYSTINKNGKIVKDIGDEEGMWTNGPKIIKINDRSCRNAFDLFENLDRADGRG